MPNFNYTVIPPVSPVNQGNTNLCWLAATSVLLAWRAGRPVPMREAATTLGSEFVSKLNGGSALTYGELPLWTRRAGFSSEPQQCLSAEGWDQLLRRRGPLVALIHGAQPSDPTKIIDHAVVVWGISGDGTGTGTHLKVCNGDGGRLETYSLRDFATVFEVPPGIDLLFSVSYFR